ncbi:OV-16 antigen [Aphelenchoides avenae]|nr:OV-16 antigen [Aphelenchus avenae]
MALRLFLAVFLMVFALVAGQSTTPTEKAFVRYKVVPDVLPVAPKEQAYVRYDSGAQARLGNVIQVSDARAQPKVLWPVDDANAFYTLMMVDPGAVRGTPRANALHWIVVNSPGTDVSKGQTLGYFGPAPPYGDGYHRYVQLVYKQTGLISATALNDPGLSGPFDVVAFAEQYLLEQPPVAGNFFRSQEV